MMTKLSLTILFAIAGACGIHAQGNGLIIHTKQGTVAGTLIIPTVRQFLGIPYAVAGRWEAPSDPPARNTVFNATTFGDTCVQSLTPSNVEFLTLVGGNGINVLESENCLSVNIWAPSAFRKQSTAVMLWIYGGAFEFGTSNIPAYNGQNIVRDNEDVTVVTFNYRLNIFGQPNSPQLISSSKSQNFGLLDLEAAVNWVHANIAAFGGDPNRIILFGQSAGSTAADAYTFSHPHDSIVKGVIEESGNLGLVSDGALGSAAFNATAWNSVSTTVGCGVDNSAAQFSCMKAVPFRTLENAVVSTNTTFNLLADNITIFADTAARAAAGNFLHVPLLGGTTAQEGDIFIVAQELLNLGFAPPGITEAEADLETLVGFTCPAGVTAQQRVNAGVPTWRYQYQAIFPDISTRPDLRAYHSSEIAIVFGTYNTSTSEVPATRSEIALSKYVQNAWVTFARDPSHGLLNFGWPMYNANTNSLAQLGNILNQTGVVFTKGAVVDAGCAVANTIAASMGTTAVSV